MNNRILWRKIFIFSVAILLLVFNPENVTDAANLSVRFLPQVPPGTWANTNNCGQTCCVMLESYYKSTTPTADRIKEVDDWLYNSSYHSVTNNYNGSYTNVDILNSILTEMMNFQNVQVLSGSTIGDLKKHLDEGNPVIIPVTRVYQGNILDHFILVKGYDENYIYCNDPGRNSSVGPNAKYTYSDLEKIIWQPGKSVVVITSSVSSSSSSPTSSTPPPSTSSTSSSGDINIEYYNTMNLSGNVIWSEKSENINKNWGTGGPGNGVQNDIFSARFSQQVNFGGGWYKFHYEVDDAIKIWVDDNCIIDKWESHVLNEDSQAVNIASGTHTICVEYADYGGDAKIVVNWYGTSAPIISKPDLSPLTISYDTNTIAVGKTILLDSGICNSGDADAAGFNIKWYVNGSQVGYGYHYDVSANTTDLYGNSSYFWTPSSPGSYTIRFVADVDDYVMESNENNNEATITIVVSEESPKLPEQSTSSNITTNTGGVPSENTIPQESGNTNISGTEPVSLNTARGPEINVDDIYTVSSMPSTISFSVTSSNKVSEVWVGNDKAVIRQDGNIFFTITDLPIGVTEFEVLAYDFNGNASEATLAVEYLKPSTVVLTIGSKDVNKDGVAMSGMDQAPVVVNGRTFLPVRFVFVNLLGGTIEWDPTSKTITSVVNGNTIKMVIGSKTAYVNGNAVTLLEAPFIESSSKRTLVPMREIMEAIGITLTWNSSSRNISILIPQ